MNLLPLKTNVCSTGRLQKNCEPRGNLITIRMRRKFEICCLLPAATCKLPPVPIHSMPSLRGCASLYEGQKRTHTHTQITIDSNFCVKCTPSVISCASSCQLHSFVSNLFRFFSEYFRGWWMLKFKYRRSLRQSHS